MNKLKAIPLFLLFLICGCGSSGGGVTTASIPPANGYTLDFQLDPAQLPAGVSTLEFVGFNASGEVVWEVGGIPRTRMSFEGLPHTATSMVVKYMASRRTIAVSTVALGSTGVLTQQVSQPQITQIDAAVESLTLNNTDVDMPVNTILLLKVDVTLTTGRVLAMRKDAFWFSTDPSVATVEKGLVQAHAEGETTIVAIIGGHSVQTSLVVGPFPDDIPDSMLDGIDPSATQPFYRVDLDTGLVTGSGDPVPIPGWNEKNKTIIVESLFGEVQIPDERPALQFSGEDLVVTTLTTPSGGLSDPRNNLYLYPTQPRKATSVYLQILQQGEVGFNLESVVYDDGLRDPFDDRGPDLTLLAPFSTELETFLGTNTQRQTGRAVLGGDIRVECGGRLIADGLLSLGLLGGDIFVRGHSLELANSQNESNFFSAQPAGRITLLAEDALTINDDIYADGGEITVISRKGTINAPVTLHARGLNGVQKYPEGTDGGKIRVFSRNPVTLARAVASGGNGVDGNYRGGDGGQITVITAGGDLDVNGGTGTPNGQNGTVRILSDSLIVSAPDNLTFNTDTGLYDGYDLPGWDPISQSLTLTLFQIDEGATMNIEGAGSFSCSSTSTTDISGTLRFPGTDESESAPASVGGAIYLSAEESIAVGQTGTIESPGGNGAESAGTGGNLQLFSPLVQVDGLLSTVGGRGSNVPSGDGGICFVEGVVSLTLGGTIDCSGQGGFNLAGDGGLVGLVTAGALDVLGKVVCVGGDSSAGGGDGGEVGMSVGGITTLGQVECDGGDSTLTPGSGGSFYLDGSDSITVNGPVTVNAGHSDTSKAGNGGIVDISGSATVSIDGSISANGTRQGQGGSIIVQGDGGVTNNGTTTATPGGTVQVTP